MIHSTLRDLLHFDEITAVSQLEEHSFCTLLNLLVINLTVDELNLLAQCLVNSEFDESIGETTMACEVLKILGDRCQERQKYIFDH